MSTEKLELSADTVLVKLYGGVTGITRRAEDKGTKHEGAAIETANLVTTRQADANEADKARKLLNQLRATVDKYCTTVINLTVTTATKLGELRAEIAPIQKQIDAHNRAARFHHVDRALVCAPIMLKADPAALAEVCRQISDELKAARLFFDLETALSAVANSPSPLDSWNGPVNNWIKRTKGLGSLFPTVTGQCIAEAITSVADLRKKVGDLTRANEKAGQTPEGALRGALKTVTEIDGALGLIDSAIGLTVITNPDAKDALDAMDAAHAEELH